jgi:2-oxoglutarate ferredoxin oxidoreductase subunit alpha
VPTPIVERREGATIGVLTVGSCDLAVREALDELALRGVLADFLRVRAFPFADDVKSFIEEHDQCFVVEQNRDAQLRSLLIIETGVPSELLTPILAYGGFPLSARDVLNGILTTIEGAPCPQ